MTQALQLKRAANDLYFSNVSHTKSCSQKIKEVIQKTWDAFKRVIVELIKRCYYCRRQQEEALLNKQRLIIEENIRRLRELYPYEDFQRVARGLPAEQIARGFLFEIKDNAGISKGYTFGTIHQLPRSFHYWHESIVENFRQSTHLGTEIGLSESQSPQQQANDQFFNDPALDQNVLSQAVEQLKLACGQLRNITPGEIETQDLAVWEQIRNLPENEAVKLKNRLNLQFYQLKLYKREHQEELWHGADDRLVFEAVLQHKPNISLESDAIHDECTRLSPAYVYRSLFGKNAEELIRDRQSIIQLADRIFETWKRGDYEAFARFYEQHKAEELLNARDPALMVNLRQMEDNFRARNIQMADTIDQFIRRGQGKLFAAFGSAHLSWQTGVNELLRQRGWTVQQVSEPVQVPMQIAQ